MTQQSCPAPFESLESSHEYVCLLQQALEDAQTTIAEEIARATIDGSARRLQALQIVSYNLSRLHEHLSCSRRILNDLRSLRRMLFAERQTPPAHREATVS